MDIKDTIGAAKRPDYRFHEHEIRPIQIKYNYLLDCIGSCSFFSKNMHITAKIMPLRLDINGVTENCCMNEIIECGKIVCILPLEYKSYSKYVESIVRSSIDIQKMTDIRIQIKIDVIQSNGSLKEWLANAAVIACYTANLPMTVIPISAKCIEKLSDKNDETIKYVYDPCLEEENNAILKNIIMGSVTVNIPYDIFAYTQSNIKKTLHNNNYKINAFSLEAGSIYINKLNTLKSNFINASLEIAELLYSKTINFRNGK